MNTNDYVAARRQRFEDETPSALAYWGTGLACLSFLIFVFWLAGMKF
ncbi:hypothetical protein [Sediminicoccus sp. KRV36]|nr:hypothetical protein [Sediminicoccus rosea]UPY37474.1 hypothetical protein LHU95_01935 [Sediminicoccus rosea]